MKPSFDDPQTCYYNYAKNFCNRTLIVKVIVENVVTCFGGTQCTYFSNSQTTEAHSSQVSTKVGQEDWESARDIIDYSFSQVGLVCLSVTLSVCRLTLRYRWNSSKIISWLSLYSLLSAMQTPTSRIHSKGNTPEILARVRYGVKWFSAYKL